MREEQCASQKRPRLGAGGDSPTWAPLPPRHQPPPAPMRFHPDGPQHHESPPKCHCKSCHSYGSEGKLQHFNDFPIESCWLMVLLGGVGGCWGGICSSPGSSTQRENWLFPPFFMCWALISTPQAIPPRWQVKWPSQATSPWYWLQPHQLFPLISFTQTASTGISAPVCDAKGGCWTTMAQLSAWIQILLTWRTLACVSSCFQPNLPRTVLERAHPPGLAVPGRTRTLGVSFVLCFAYRRNTSLFTHVALPCFRKIQINYKNYRQNLGLLKHFRQGLGGKLGLSYSERNPAPRLTQTSQVHWGCWSQQLAFHLHPAFISAVRCALTTGFQTQQDFAYIT